MITFIRDIFNTAFLSIWANKLRTSLSVFAVTLALLAVIILGFAWDTERETLSLGQRMLASAVSIILGGMVIMNAMFASVGERTKEIAIRKTVGAAQGDIMFQFLAESLVLSLTGGIMAIIVSTLFSAIGVILPLSPGWSMGGTLLLSLAMGLIFGTAPAYKASQEDTSATLR